MKNLSGIGRSREDVEIGIDKPVRSGLVTSEDVKMLVLSHGGLITENWSSRKLCIRRGCQISVKSICL